MADNKRTPSDEAPPSRPVKSETARHERPLTMRQQKVLKVIRDSVSTRGYPPSVREIGEMVGLKSPSSVAHQLAVLERKGFLRKDRNRPRAVDVRPSDDFDPAVPQMNEHGVAMHPTPAYVPVVGRIAAGGPILAEEAVEDIFPLPRELVGDGSHFLLRVVGDSMRTPSITLPRLNGSVTPLRFTTARTASSTVVNRRWQSWQQRRRRMV